MALWMEGRSSTVEGLSNVHSSSTTHNSDRARWQLHMPSWKSSIHFHFQRIKSYSTILLFRIPCFTDSPKKLSTLAVL